MLTKNKPELKNLFNGFVEAMKGSNRICEKLLKDGIYIAFGQKYYIARVKNLYQFLKWHFTISINITVTIKMYSNQK